MTITPTGDGPAGTSRWRCGPRPGVAGASARGQPPSQSPLPSRSYRASPVFFQARVDRTFLIHDTRRVRDNRITPTHILQGKFLLPNNIWARENSSVRPIAGMVLLVFVSVNSTLYSVDFLTFSTEILEESFCAIDIDQLTRDLLRVSGSYIWSGKCYFVSCSDCPKLRLGLGGCACLCGEVWGPECCPRHWRRCVYSGFQVSVC